MVQFFETRRGVKFYDNDVPRIANALESIAKQLELLNANMSKKKNLWAVNIDWDTDDENIDLPAEVKLPRNFDADSDIADYLSDIYGFCINSVATEYRGE